MNANKECVLFEDSEMRNLDAAKDATLEALVKAGLLAEAAAEEFGSTHGIVAYRNSWYKKFFKRDGEGEVYVQCIELNFAKDLPGEE